MSKLFEFVVDQSSPTGPQQLIPVESVGSLLCENSEALKKVHLTLLELLGEIRALRTDIVDGIERSSLGIEKANEVVDSLGILASAIKEG